MKNKTTLFSITFNVGENKVHLFSHFGLRAEILTIFAFYQSSCLVEITCKENPCSLKITLSLLK